MIHQADIVQTNAVQVGSRIEYRLLMAGQPEQIKALRKSLSSKKSVTF